jgi:uncharacterized protein
MSQRIDPDGLRLPIKLDSTSNGEFEPVPLEPVHEFANRLAFERAAEHARRTGLGRREFLVSAAGAATTLLAMNQAYAAAGRSGGFYQLAAEAGLDQDAAAAGVAGNEFIFDVQGHFVNPTGAWLKTLPEGARPFRGFAADRCAAAAMGGQFDHIQCLGPDAFIKDVFLDSDTDLMVLSFVPSTREGEPLTIEEAAATAGIVEKLEGTHRLYLHGRVNPNQPGDLDSMDWLAGNFPIRAWKTYTQYGPGGVGFFMDDEPGIAMIEKARALGVPNIAIHKGLPFGPRSYEHSTCAEMGRVAKRYPDVNFLIYHSGFVTDKPEGPYDPEREDGIDALITAAREAELGPRSNLYAELGSTWRFLMRDPDSAAHALGKLLLHLGEDNILWGTDSIWYGSPQDQIQAFRSFQIAPELREKHGYPEITPAIRAKIFGLNALRIYPVPPEVLERHVEADRVAALREDYRERRDPHFATYGPKTRREFLNLRAWGG